MCRTCCVDHDQAGDPKSQQHIPSCRLSRLNLQKISTDTSFLLAEADKETQEFKTKRLKRSRHPLKTKDVISGQGMLIADNITCKNL